MSLATQGNTDLAFNTVDFRQQGAKYGNIAVSLRDLAKQLDDCLTELKNSGWTTPAGTAFQKMAETNWKDNINKYADLLDTLKAILDDAATKYDGLNTSIEETKL